MCKCKVIEKCKKCQCNKQQSTGLSEKLAKHRPAERIVERQIVELAARCEKCCCENKEAENAD